MDASPNSVPTKMSFVHMLALGFFYIQLKQARTAFVVVDQYNYSFYISVSIPKKK
jgi:hypothetical protein